MRRQLVRGWALFSGETVLEKLSVDNVLTADDPLLGGSQFDAADGLSGDNRPEYLLRRFICDLVGFGIPGGFNLSGGVWGNWTLGIWDLDNLNALNAAGGLPLLEPNYINEGHVLHQGRAFIPGAIPNPDSETPAYTGLTGPWHRTIDLSFRGGYNIRNGQVLALVFNQDQAITSWVEGDSIEWRYAGKCLFQQRRPA